MLYRQTSDHISLCRCTVDAVAFAIVLVINYILHIDDAKMHQLAKQLQNTIDRNARTLLLCYSN
jgi:hypothetical protein